MNISAGKPLRGATVKLRSLGKRYEQVLAVDRVSLEVERGEFLTLLGPSGSGKTTTLMMIAGFTPPSAGEVLIDDRPVTWLPPYRRNIGVVFQNYALFPHMTVFENVAFPLRVRKVDQHTIRDKVQGALALVNLLGTETRYPSQLSGGQQQRVALARALVFEPPILLMDEPLGSLDKKLRDRMQLEIKQLQAELQVTVIYVTHDQEEALRMSDRVAVMNVGQIQQVGSAEELYERPRTRFVAEFVGESNLLRISAHRRRQGHWVLETAGGLTVVLSSVEPAPDTVEGYVVVRPERIAIGREDLSLPNQFEGTVVGVMYGGETIRYTVRLGRETMAVKKANSPSIDRFKPGEAVWIGWGVKDGWVV